MIKSVNTRKPVFTDTITALDQISDQGFSGDSGPICASEKEVTILAPQNVSLRVTFSNAGMGYIGFHLSGLNRNL